MITYKTGNLFEDDAQALVNAVNCVGVMGAGIAAEFKRRWPSYFKDYQQICEANGLRPGIVIFHAIPDRPGRYIVSLPTKDHWKHPSNLVNVHRGLNTLIAMMRKHGVQSVAMPALGCGNGGLDWGDVKTLIDLTAKANPDLDIRVYEPGFDERPLKLP